MARSLRARARREPGERSGGLPAGPGEDAVYDLPQPATARQNYNLAFFLQDDWKLTPALTVNVGLRYEYQAPMWVTVTSTRASIHSGPGAGRRVERLAHARPRGGHGQLAPRVGFAYTVNDKTVVRSAFGLFYGQIFSNLGGIVLYPASP